MKKSNDEFFSAGFLTAAEETMRKIKTEVELSWQKIEPEDLPKAKKHLHQKTEEIFLVFEGGITLAVQGKKSIINKGEFVLVERGNTHQVVGIKKGTVMLTIKIPAVPGDTVCV